MKDLKTNKSRWDENKSKRFAGLNPSRLTLIRSRIRIVLVSTLKTTRSRSHIASVNIIPRIVDPTVVPTLDLDLGQPKPKPAWAKPYNAILERLPTRKVRSHHAQRHSPNTSQPKSTSTQSQTSRIPATKFSSTTRNLPKTVVCPLYPRPPLTITVDKRRNK